MIMVNASPTQLKTFYEQISCVTQPEELFGDLGNTPDQQMDQLERSYKSLIKLYHPDRYANQPANLYYVNEIAKALNDLKHRAVMKIKSSAYGVANPGEYKSIIRTAQREYFVTGLLVEGSLADVYHAFYLDPYDRDQPRREVVIKIIADPARNELVEQEAAFYQTLSHFCFPGFVECFCTMQRSRAVVLSYIADGFDLLELTRSYRQLYGAPGLPQEHLVWILDRFLCALGMLHQNRILHGNIQPDNLMIQPKLHNGLLIDFLHCRIAPAPEDVFAVVNPAYCAPEVLTRHFKPHPVSDIYALGRCMIEMLGGSGSSLDDSIDLHPSLRLLLHKMVLPDPAERAADAWALAGELKALRQQIYGSTKHFIPLEIGGSYGRR
jgi:serine/threonine protein kinase